MPFYMHLMKNWINNMAKLPIKAKKHTQSCYGCTTTSKEECSKSITCGNSDLSFNILLAEIVLCSKWSSFSPHKAVLQKWEFHIKYSYSLATVKYQSSTAEGLKYFYKNPTLNLRKFYFGIFTCRMKRQKSKLCLTSTWWKQSSGK